MASFRSFLHGNCETGQFMAINRHFNALNGRKKLKTDFLRIKTDVLRL